MTIMALRKFGDAGHRGQTADAAEPAEPVEAAAPVVDPDDPQGLSRTALRHLGAARGLPEVEGEDPEAP
jgi:hypothetical protein